MPERLRQKRETAPAVVPFPIPAGISKERLRDVTKARADLTYRWKKFHEVEVLMAEQKVRLESLERDISNDEIAIVHALNCGAQIID